MHFEENYKRGNNNTNWDRCLDKREIVEILDDELNVCSLHYEIARTIIAKDPPEKYTEEGWKNHQANEWKNLKEWAQAAEVISLAYQPVQLKLRVNKSDEWMEATKVLQFHQPLHLRTKENQSVFWMEATEIKTRIKEAKLDELEFWTQDDRNNNLQGKWMKFKEIEEKDKADQPLKLRTRNVSAAWMEVKDIFRHLGPLQLLVDVDTNWMEATDILQHHEPLSLYTKEGWKLSWTKLEEIKNKANQLLELELKEDSGETVWKKLKDIKNEANQQLKLCIGVSNWMNAEEIYKHDEGLLSLRMREVSRKEDSRECNWKKLKEIKEAKHYQSREFFTKYGWKKLEIKEGANSKLEIRTIESSKAKEGEVQEIKNEADQELKLWTIEKDWKLVEEIIEYDQPPSLWV
ncbi:hypothetical protein SLEP1_g41359 [Rubroshorea leprosula]|nr:hypothetical protein SLEP1_g41359 [Rubroshorea leprosula]